MHPSLFPFRNPFLFNGDLSEGFESSRVFFSVSLLLSQGGGMDFSKKVGEKIRSSQSKVGEKIRSSQSKVGEKIRSSVRSARSLTTKPSSSSSSSPSSSSSDRPEVPARALAAAAVAAAIVGLPTSSKELSSMYESQHQGQLVDDIEEEFYEEHFDPVRHILEHIPSEESDLSYFETQATLRLSQLDKVAEQLSLNVMEHHEVMVKGMHLVRELEKDLKVANVICMNGRRHLNSSMNEVSRDLIVHSKAKRKQALTEILPFLADLRHATEMQMALESLVEEGNFCKAFQVLSEYLQLLDSYSELSLIQEMSRGVEVWLGKTLQKLDSLLIGVCQEFKVESYLTVIDAYALIGDISGLAEKIQSFYMQEVISETHRVLKKTIEEDQELGRKISRLTYSDLCLLIPEPKFRSCLLRTLAVLYRLMCSYYEILGFRLKDKVSVCGPSNLKKKGDLFCRLPDVLAVNSVTEKSCNSKGDNSLAFEPADRTSGSSSAEEPKTVIFGANTTGTSGSLYIDNDPVHETSNNGSSASSSGSPWYQLRKDATSFVSQTLQRGCKNLWQLTTSRLSVLLSSSAASSTSIHQFLRNYEDFSVFILAGEAFCGVKADEFRQKLKALCENYFVAFHRQNVYALKMVLERENWMKLPPDTVDVINFSGLVGGGAAGLVASHGNSPCSGGTHSHKSMSLFDTAAKKSEFSYWLRSGNPFLLKLTAMSKEYSNANILNGASTGEFDGKASDTFHEYKTSPRNINVNNKDSPTSVPEEENEDLLADFIDEDSQLPSRISKPKLSRHLSLRGNEEEVSAQTGSSLCLLRSMDKYARLMQKLELVNVELFKGMCQLFGIFYQFVFETFSQQISCPSGKNPDALNYRLKTALSRIDQDCDQWTKPQSSPAMSSSTSFTDVTPTVPSSTNCAYTSGTTFSLQERCAGAETIGLVARILHRSKGHLQSMLLQNNAAIVDDFFTHLVDSVADLTELIHRATARLLLHITGYADRIANAKWEVKEIGLEHNGYVDLLLGEFKHYKTRLSHGGIQNEVQAILLEYAVEIVAETLIEGLSRVKKCTDEGRALMSLDLQVLISGLQHFVAVNVKPKLQLVETFIKAYYLPETEYVHWAHSHPEYSKAQIIALVNLVATMKGWKRKTRLEILEKIESPGG